MLLDQEYFCFHNCLGKMMPSCFSCFFYKSSSKIILTCENFDKKDFILWDLEIASKIGPSIHPKKIKIFKNSSEEEVVNYINSLGYNLFDYHNGFWENSSGVPSQEDEIESQNKIEMEAYKRFIERSLFSDRHLFFRRDILFASLIDLCRKNGINDSWSESRRGENSHNSGYYYGYNNYSRYPTISEIENSFDKVDMSIALDWIIWQECFLKEDNNSLVAPEVYFQSFWNFNKIVEDSLSLNAIQEILDKMSTNSILSNWSFN